MAEMQRKKQESGASNICLLTETYYPITGGGETQARVLAAGFAAAGSATNVLTRRTDSNLPRSEPMDGAMLWRLAPAGPGHLKKWGLIFSAFIRLLRLRSHYDVILVGGYRVLGIPSVIAGRLLGKPCILKADSIGEFSGEFFNPGLKRFRLRYDRFPINIALAMRNTILRRADAFIAISSVIADELRANGVDAERISSIPNSVNIERFSPASAAEKTQLRDTLSIPRDAQVGVYTGRLASTKGLPLLLQSWGSIVERHPDALLLLVGAGGVGLQNCETELRSFVNNNSLERYVRFTGSVNNVHHYLQASDFFVFPTEREAFGISVIEALACGLPVVTTATGGIRDIVTDRDNAIVVPVDDEKALGRAVETMLQGGDAIESMAKVGKRLATERYSETKVLQLYKQLVADLASAKSNG
uniref:Glycosyl transferase n=1 Tax=uncultured bacterium ws198A12 TaxID=1131830 RepID=I1X5H9_9BACT|nr:glycosyl transferase [uncultured bacterium ws198A12]